MADLLNEIESFVTYLSSIFPTASIERQNVPTNPTPNTFVVKFTKTETDQRQEITFVERTFSIIYIGNNDIDVITQMETLRQDLQQKKKVIPLNNSTTIMRVNEFNYSEPFLYDGGNKGIIGVLTVETSETNDSVSGTTIAEVNTN